jgi:hypothetical protein
MYRNIFFKITKLNLKRLDSRIDMERIRKNRSFESLEALRRRTASFAADGECTGAKNANFLLVDRRGMVGAWRGERMCIHPRLRGNGLIWPDDFETFIVHI